ncbi:RHS repeat domain-containing protein, partial [Desulfitobacterium sp.]|uniref:RHS repeat domain-containing protein n=1 Tax=Desulfitobacterium sp. TaxID=49981 RepID=UPI002C8094DA
MKRMFLMKTVMTLMVIFLISVSPVLAMTYGYDDLGRLTSVTYDSGQSITYNYDSAGNMISKTNSLISETLTVRSTTTGGITLALSPALDGLNTSNFKLVDSSNNPVTITGAVTTDNGATYLLSASLSAGQTYTVTATKSGYDFGAAQNVVVPGLIAETLTVSNTTSSGITIALSPVLNGLTLSDFTLMDGSTPVTISSATT